MRKLKNLFKNNKFGVIFKYSFIKYVALILGFLKGIINARELGPEVLGILGNLLLILSYLSYSNLGILHSMSREYVIYKDKDYKKSKEVLYTSFTSLMIISIFFIAIALVIKLFNLQSNSGDYLIYVFIIAIFEQFKTFYITYFRLIDKFTKINFIELINNLGVFMLILVFIKQYKIYAVLYAMIICGFISFLYGIYNCERIRFRINYSILKDLIVIGVPLLIYNLGFYILTTIDRLMIIKYLNYEALGYYTFSNQIVGATLVFISSVLFLYYPKAIKTLNVEQNFNKDEIYQSVKKYTKYVEIVGVILCIVGSILIKPFVDIIVPNYQVSINIYRILVIGTIATQVSYFANVFIVSNKNQKYLVLLQFITIAVSVMLNYVFIKLGMGILGISIATMITNIIYSIMQYIIFLRLLNYEKNSFKIILITYYKFILFVCIILSVSVIQVSYTFYIITLVGTLGVLYVEDVINIIKSVAQLQNNIKFNLK